MVQDAVDGLHEKEIIVVKDVAASIQLKRSRPVGPPVMSGPTQSADSIPEWLILFKGDKALVLKGDKITDDSGISYEVEAPYWNSLGWNLMARLYHP